MDKIERFLRKRFSDGQLVKEILAKSKFMEIPAHTRILEQDAYVAVVPYVYEGRIKVMRRGEQGKEVLLYYIHPGESCALSIVAGLTRTQSVAYAETESDTKLLSIPVDVLNDLHTRFPQCNEFFLTLFRDRFREIVFFIDSVTFKTMDFRLVQLLKQKQEQEQNNMIPVTHQQLANELGTAREVVSRLLKQLENERKIIQHRSSIEIKTQL